MGAAKYQSYFFHSPVKYPGEVVQIYSGASGESIYLAETTVAELLNLLQSGAARH